MEKLVDVFGTKYFHRDFTGKISAYLTEHKEVDIADARLCRDVVDIISTFLQTGAYVIDSLNPFRDKLLAENRHRRDTQEEYNRLVTPLPLPTSVENLFNFIGDLSQEKIYRVGANFFNLQFAILVTIYNPRVKLDFYNMYHELFSYINDNIDMKKFKGKPLKMLVGTSFLKVSPNPDGSLYIPFRGNVPYEEAITYELFIPGEFGEEYLDTEGIVSPWTKFIDLVIEDFLDSLAPKSYSLKDFI